MFGNRLGWFLATPLAILFAVAFYQAARTNALTPPTPLLESAAAYEPLTTEVSPDAVVPLDPVGDARPLYQQAIDAVTREPGRYAALAESRDPAMIEQSPAVSALLAAARRPGEPLGDVATRVNYDPPGDDFDALLTAARCCAHAADLYAAKAPDKARLLYEAEFALGSKLFAGRVRAYEATAGLSLAREAVLGLRDLPGTDARRAALLSTFDRAAAGLDSRRITPLWNAIGALDPDVIATHAGDVYALTDRRVKERLWRVEAVLALGRHKFNLDRDADRLIVPRRLSELEAGETDAAVLAAIRAARGLTVEQYRTIR